MTAPVFPSLKKGQKYTQAFSEEVAAAGNALAGQVGTAVQQATTAATQATQAAKDAASPPFFTDAEFDQLATVLGPKLLTYLQTKFAPLGSTTTTTTPATGTTTGSGTTTSSGTTTGTTTTSPPASTAGTLVPITSWPTLIALVLSNGGSTLTQDGSANNGEATSTKFIPAGGSTQTVQFEATANGKTSGILRLGDSSPQHQNDFGMYLTSSNTVLVRVGSEYLSDNVALSGTVTMRMRLDGTKVHFERSSNGGTSWTEIINANDSVSSARPQPNKPLYVKVFTDLFSQFNYSEVLTNVQGTNLS